jgi:hypothetical protein
MKRRMKNEILKEVWAAKDALAAKYNYSIDELFRDLREREKTSGRRYVDLSQPSRKSRGKRLAHV